MDKKFLKKIIAQSPEDLQIISACCSEAKVNTSEIKYLPSNKMFLLSLLRFDKENENNNSSIKSIIKFEESPCVMNFIEHLNYNQIRSEQFFDNMKYCLNTQIESEIMMKIKLIFETAIENWKLGGDKVEELIMKRLQE